MVILQKFYYIIKITSLDCICHIFDVGNIDVYINFFLILKLNFHIARHVLKIL